MIIPAEVYGLLRFHSVWYVINLLGGAGVGGWTNPTSAEIAQFHLQALLTATVIHAATCLLVGLVYGAMLPLWPKRPILLGGLIAPVLWTGLLYTVLGIVNPFLEKRIDWWSFAASQFAFGLVAGYTVVKLGHIKQLAQVSLIQYRNPLSEPWDGETAKVPAYVRLSATREFTVFAINCAHLGCPVRFRSHNSSCVLATEEFFTLTAAELQARPSAVFLPIITASRAASF